MEPAQGGPTEDETEVWQCPLPKDITYEIMASQLKPSFRDLLALSSTCKSMYTISIPFRYRYVSINSSDKVDVESSTAAEVFAGRLLQRPDIAQYVKVLKIVGDKYVDDEGEWQISRAEENCLRYILNHNGYTNLTTIALALPIQWACLPRAIRDGCISILQYPTLQHVKLYIETLPRWIFGLLPPELTHLELRGSVYSEYFFDDQNFDMNRLTICRPRQLEIWDPDFQLDRPGRLFAPDSTLQLNGTTWLKVIMCDFWLPSLEGTISKCRNTLTHLEIHHSLRPEMIRLGELPHLETLILSADLRLLPYAGSAHVGPRNFPWLIHCLQSLITSNTICPVRSITFLLRVVSFSIIQSPRMKWDDFDRVFQPSVHHKWPNLETFIVHMVNGDKDATVASFDAVQTRSFLVVHAPMLHEAQPTEAIISAMEQGLGGPTGDETEQWQWPLPKDITFEIMASQLKPSFSDMLALSSTCKSMYSTSIPLRYRYVSIYSASLNSKASPGPSSAAAFAGRLLQRPDIAQFVKVLKIAGDKYVDRFGWRKWRISTAEEECLRYILNHDGYTNLKTLAFSLPVPWSMLPKAMQDACLSIFQRPRLEQVKLNVEHFPRCLLGLLPSTITHLELRGSFHPDSCVDDVDEDLADIRMDNLTICRPRQLEIWDPEHQLDGGFLLFAPDSPLQASATTWLKFIVSPFRVVQSPERAISQCRNTLTHLEIHHSFGWETLPLGDLPHLETLILSAYLRHETIAYPWPGGDHHGPHSFTWLIDTLRSLITSDTICPVRSITVILRVSSFDAIQESSNASAWDVLDHVFQPAAHYKWPNLETFLIHIGNEEEHATLASFDAIQSHAFLAERVPTLCETQLLKVEASCRMPRLWTAWEAPKWDLWQEYV
ncbi:hypothetical protein CVT24_006315 [Panaeolus cyanescens]|uniref:F-box domain-containing protein n=1 Tax=Panaeolus cyanescens TaxID=181874 RepID=A0A409YEE4_9AGAR|nr:hypothetical protein CVT24_006315 [Panaeolus cyanescens]